MAKAHATECDGGRGPLSAAETENVSNPEGGFMIRSKIQKYEMLTRVADFAARNVSVFPKETAAAELAKDILSAVEKLAQCKASQAAAIEQLRVGTEQRLAKQEALRNQLDAIRQTAKALNIGGFSLPERPHVSAFFDSARIYTEAVGELKPEFVRHGLPPDFIENLKSAAEGLQRAIESQVAGRGRGKAAIQGFRQDTRNSVCLNATLRGAPVEQHVRKHFGHGCLGGGSPHRKAPEFQKSCCRGRCAVAP
jgi:hypothetical protein